MPQSVAYSLQSYPDPLCPATPDSPGAPVNSTSSPPSPLSDANAAPAPSRSDRLFTRFPSFALALAMTIVGTNVGIGKTMVAVMPVAAFALWRFIIAVIALAPRYRPSAMRRVTRTQWLHLFVQTFFGTFLFTLLMLSGVRMTTATAAGVITATLPACVALLSWAVLREHPSRRALVSIALAIAGVALLNVSRGDSHGAADAGNAWLGNVLVLGAVVCEGIYVIVSKRLAAELPAIDICAYTHLLGGAMMLPFGLVGLMAVDYAALTPGHWTLIVWYGLAASVFSFFLWMRGIRHVSAQLAGVFTAMVPVAATAYGVVFLGERLTIAQSAALALTITGIILAALPPAGARKTLLQGKD